MKHFLWAMIALACTLALGSCSDDNDAKGNSWYDSSVFDGTYTINSDGYCVLKGARVLTQDEVYGNIVGYGWKCVGTFEVNGKGKLSKTDYYTNMIGGSPSHYSFDSHSQLTAFFHSDALPANAYETMGWSYDTALGFIYTDEQSGSANTPDNYWQVAKIGEKDGRIYMYTVHMLGIQTGDDGSTKPQFGVSVYERLTASELDEMRRTYNYDAGKDRTVPSVCKFRVKARYATPDEYGEDTNGAVITSFRPVRFTLTDALGTSILPNPALEYFDSIVWKCTDTNGSYTIHRRTDGSSSSSVQWTTCFLHTGYNIVSSFCGYKDGRMVYEYTMPHIVSDDKFLCFDWQSCHTGKQRSYTAFSALDPADKFTVYEPYSPDGTLGRIFAELRYVSQPKGQGNDSAILKKELQMLSSLMTNHFSTGTIVGAAADRYRALFRSMPENADILTYWETADTRIALVKHKSEDKAEDNYFYVHAEPKE